MVKVKEPENSKKKILVAPINAVGHVNACIGVAKPLLNRGHNVAFFVDTTYKNKLKSHGFDEFLFEPYENDKDNDVDDVKKKSKNPGEHMAEMLIKHKILGQNDPRIQIEHMTRKPIHSENERRYYDKKMCEIIEKFQPDLFIVDNMLLEPSIYYSGKPWIRIISVVPLIHLLHLPQLPPPWTGFDSNEMHKNQDEWLELRTKLNIFNQSKLINDYHEKLGYERYPNDLLAPPTQALTIYAFPEEYDYPEIQQHHPDWFNIDVFNKNEQNDKIILSEFLPKEFYDNTLNGKFSGKYIYVSLGSMGSIDLNLMKHLSSILSRTNHKYIVSKGPRHNEYKLIGENQWGDRFLPQMKILPVIDLVITHGGNNTVTETFAHGKPMIILPLFAD